MRMKPKDFPIPNPVKQSQQAVAGLEVREAAKTLLTYQEVSLGQC